MSTRSLHKSSNVPSNSTRKATANEPSGRNRIAPGKRPVDEATRIDISAALAQFQSSDATEYTFPKGLSNHDRAVVHSECKKYGFASKSYGKGAQRAVTVFKRNPKAARAHDMYVMDLHLSSHSLSRLNSYFALHPPTKQEIDAGCDPVKARPAATMQQTRSQAAATKYREPHRGDVSGIHRAASFDEEEIVRREMAWQAGLSNPRMTSILAARASLPIAPYKQEIIDTIRKNPVVLIAGETGCGKTTQVPQYILEDCWQRRMGCRIVCTQPRRISAVSVADRVAVERGERVGYNVGYTIRLESRGGPDTSILFCTNGVLLRMLTDPAHDALSHVTHLLIDEIHERDKFADFLLIIIRDVLPSHPHLHVVLMSATLHIDLFSKYFGGCPVVKVPGFTHPVKDYYLEDILKLTGYTVISELDSRNCGEESSFRLETRRRREIESAIEKAFINGTDEEFEALLEITGAEEFQTDYQANLNVVNVQHPATGATPLLAAAFHGRVDIVTALLANGADPALTASNGMTAMDCATQFGHEDVVGLLQEWGRNAKASTDAASVALALSKYQSNTDADEVDIELIESLLCFIFGERQFMGKKPFCFTSDGGAVLIFLPGWDEILRLKDRLEESRDDFGLKSKYLILPLHSMVAPAEQKKVFVRPPAGTRKIVLSTNIAETAVTIDDVVCVIDSGRLKEKSYDPFTGVSTLQAAWISKASERQRRGRAGRCQPGIAFHMYSRQRSESLVEFQLPELKRTPLDEMALQVKLLERTSQQRIGEFLSKAVEPPVPHAVDAAVSLLKDIGALEEDEHLTSLGRHLAALPLPPALGKMLLYGVLYKCLDPVLTVACCMAYRDPWVLPLQAEARRRATQWRCLQSTEAGGCSDHLATVRAYNGWKAMAAMEQQRSQSAGYSPALHRYCSQHHLSAATINMVDGMRTQLLDELISRRFVTSLEEASVNGHRADLVRAVLGCGLYPLVTRIVPATDKGGVAKGLVTRKGEKVRIHPASVNAVQLRNAATVNSKSSMRELVFYDELTRGESLLYVKSCTTMHPHPLILVAAHCKVAEGERWSSSSESDDEGQGRLTSRCSVKEILNGVEHLELSQTQPKSQSSSDYNIVTIDGWLNLRVRSSAVHQLACLRTRLAAAFTEKVSHPHKRLSPSLQQAVDLSASLFVDESLLGRRENRNLVTSFRSGDKGQVESRYGRGRLPIASSRRGGLHRTKR
jgi:ATP-dependent RNA helicase DHX36